MTLEVYIIIGFLFFAIIEAIEDVYSIKKLGNGAISETQRVKLYIKNIVWGWLRTALSLVVVMICRVSLESIGFTKPYFLNHNINIAIGIIVYLVGVGFSLLLIYQIIMFLISKKYRIEIKKVINNKGGSDGVDKMLPRTRKEKVWFTYCALTAAIGEEIVYRGFLFYLLLTILPGQNIYIILIVGSALFGFAHLYQGLTGIIRTGLTGCMLGALYLVSGSLIFSIILHFIIDFSANFLYDDKKEEEDTRENSL